MQSRFLAVLAALAALVLSAPADAQSTGFYGAVDLGYHTPDFRSAKAADLFTPFVLSSRGNAGGFLRFGRAFDSGLRTELELGYQPSSLKTARTSEIIPFIPAGDYGSTSGHANATTLMANLLYDIPTGFALQPFIGAGAGVVHTAIDAHSVGAFCPICAVPAICFPAGCGFSNLRIDDGDDEFGWQAIGGVSWPFADLWALDLTYRYTHGSRGTWNAQSGGFIFAPRQFHGDISDSVVTAGIRYSFGD
jgi:opacity protein-like surface antigen